MKMISTSFRLERGSSLSNRLERSNSSLLASQYISPGITTYKKLSKSSRFAEETPPISSSYHDHHRRGNKSGWSFLSKVFSSFKKTDAQAHPTPSAVQEKKKKTSWLPDPQQRWPVQGW
ncbi:hypothetical protein POM88_028475 [Heracleum sosnowskyi]|uniref:Uncharacterized protein n=1 Tax=Heracleum sosnowskyi TaxID=360622 RepID=A0AAD8HTP2_9APIA|nr:hypothetical protein POM88_028475 [Heracleum sosnowskyi]